MKKIHKTIILSVALAIISIGCTGAHLAMKLADLQYPASLSPYLYGPDFTIKKIHKDLEVVGKYNHSKFYLGLFFTFLSIGDDSEFAETLNAEIKKLGADGIVNVSITVNDKIMNHIPMTFVIPIWPGGATVNVTGDIVKLKK